MRKIVILSFLTIIFAQNKTLELQDVMCGTFRYDRIGSYNWVNNQDDIIFLNQTLLVNIFMYMV